MIAFVHHKGGTGKTTACLNIAGWLVKSGKNVLVVDLDPQGNATTGLGIERKSVDYSIYDVLFGKKRLTEIILETSSGIYVAPSSVDLLAAETHMAGIGNQTRLLKQHLGEVEEHFDYILIDVSPGSTMLMINGIVAAENIIIPLDSGIFAYETMETLKTLLQHIHDEIGLPVNVMFVILRENPMENLKLFIPTPTKEINELVKQFFITNGGEVPKIFKVPFSEKVYKSQVKGVPISHYSPFSNVGRAFKKITKEVIKYGNLDQETRS